MSDNVQDLLTIDEFNKDCAQACVLLAPTDLKGFDWSILLDIALDFLMDFLAGCGDDDSVFSHIKDRSRLARYASRRAIRMARREIGDRTLGVIPVAADGLLSSAESAGKQGLRQMRVESNEVRPNFDNVFGD